MINMLFARLHHIYTHRFESAYPDDDTLALAKREWSFALSDIPLSAVEATINLVRDEHAWPPTVAEFLQALCIAALPQDMPTPYDAYREACHHANQPHVHHWRHPAVFAAAQKTGFQQLRERPEHQVWPHFRRAYQAMILAVMRGQQFELPKVVHLEDQTPQITDAATQTADWCAQHQLEPSEVAHLFHYLELPPKSAIRHNFRQRALHQLAARGYVTTDLPE